MDIPGSLDELWRDGSGFLSLQASSDSLQGRSSRKCFCIKAQTSIHHVARSQRKKLKGHAAFLRADQPKGYIQACRALMIAAVSLGFFGSIFALVGMKCTKIGGSDRTKDKIACSAGVTFILSGLSSLTGCSLYAHRITSEYFDPNFVSQKYEFGIALFIGWAGAVLCLIGGSIFCCSMAERSKIQRKRNPYTGASSTMSFQTKVNSAAANLISNQGIPKHFDKNAYV
ncbi:claudin-10 isoform X2 [Rhinatrema bivittatum]|uniref:claudin-10 isoform X2 n=1 Tax=Rhinatrema bivittatum TaxID=194408 RepID=UPI00112DA4D2|nr:claudin-10 isoform X2 [Rhinatrema bivittatum]XP_029460589.1 claudin-10 isoform X2 [Rhinatrema bivittatum]XP_029460590.1 claudin-10 isoform X2 [Rhinatrema bivittatum]